MEEDNQERPDAPAPVTRASRRPRLSLTLGIRAWVLLATLMAILPLLGFSVHTVVTLVQAHHANDDDALIQRSRSASLALKRRFDRASAALEALSVSAAALNQDFPALYQQAQRVIGAHPDAVAINLVRADGTQVFTTITPYRSELPLSHAAPLQTAVFDSGATVYTPLYSGSVTGREVMSVSVPVRIAGKVAFALGMSLPSEALTAVLQEQVLPTEWTAAVIDPNGIIAGRSRDADRLVGRPTTPSLRAAIRNGAACPYRTRIHDGAELSSCASQVVGSAWYVAIGVPSDAFEHDLRDSLVKLMIGGAASVLLGIAGAVAIANLIRRQVKLLTIAAVPGQPRDAGADLPASSIREVAAVNEGLLHARRREDRLASLLSQAKHDSLTGLAGRELFRELVERDLETAHRHTERVAILFIDLDGFKAINDRLGHDAGDELLRDVAGAIRRVVRGSDIPSRLGGDEFVVYLRGPGLDLASVCVFVALRLIDRVSRLGSGLGCSVGIAVGVASSASVTELLGMADRLMLQAKAAGKGRYVIEEVGGGE